MSDMWSWTIKNGHYFQLFSQINRKQYQCFDKSKVSRDTNYYDYGMGEQNAIKLKPERTTSL